MRGALWEIQNCDDLDRIKWIARITLDKVALR